MHVVVNNSLQTTLSSVSGRMLRSGRSVQYEAFEPVVTSRTNRSCKERLCRIEFFQPRTILKQKYDFDLNYFAIHKLKRTVTLNCFNISKN